MNLGMTVGKSYSARTGMLATGQLHKARPRSVGGIKYRVIKRVGMFIEQDIHVGGSGEMKIRHLFGSIPISAIARIEFGAITQGGVHRHAPCAIAPSPRSLRSRKIVGRRTGKHLKIFPQESPQ